MYEFLGPILLVMDSAPANVWTGVVLTLVLLPAIASVFFRPRQWKLGVSIIAAAIWFGVGVVAHAINC